MKLIATCLFLALVPFTYTIGQLRYVMNSSSRIPYVVMIRHNGVTNGATGFTLGTDLDVQVLNVGGHISDLQMKAAIDAANPPVLGGQVTCTIGGNTYPATASAYEETDEENEIYALVIDY